MNRRKLLNGLILPALLLLTTTLFAQTKTVSGSVTDASGAGAASVTVSAKGQSNATSTNETGQFTITVPQATTTLVFSSVGFTTSEVNIGSQTSLNVVLQTEAGNLNEVVVIGYGTARKRDLTGSITTVTAKDFNKGTITTPEQLIVGKVAGVQIISNGGAPGAGSTIRIRGWRIAQCQ
jgi:iron complex outermembrane receptor protein